MQIIDNKIPEAINEMIESITKIYGTDSKVSKIFEAGIKNTYQTTILKLEEDKTFVITGDIPAMWLRDSSAQLKPFLRIVNKSNEVKDTIKGLIKQQMELIAIDPYANAFNLNPEEDNIHSSDLPATDPRVWERKYEIDSLCYPVELAYLYYMETKDKSIFTEEFLSAMKIIFSLFKLEQNHHEDSKYSFVRYADWLLFDEPERIEFETLKNEGRGSDCSYTGMTWCGFRPSDDACKYGYLVPSNMFAVVILKYMSEIINNIYGEKEFSNEIQTLAEQIDSGIKKYGIVNHEVYGEIYAYEVDGLGNANLMDDANIPSLLSLPYLNYCSTSDKVYQNTRRFILSKSNPYFYSGTFAKGIGSPHTPENYIWHMSLAMQGITSTSDVEKEEILSTLIKTDADENMMHEGFDVENPSNFTRPWFSWANAMFAEFVLQKNKL